MVDSNILVVISGIGDDMGPVGYNLRVSAEWEARKGGEIF